MPAATLVPPSSICSSTISCKTQTSTSKNHTEQRLPSALELVLGDQFGDERPPSCVRWYEEPCRPLIYTFFSAQYRQFGAPTSPGIEAAMPMQLLSHRYGHFAGQPSSQGLQTLCQYRRLEWRCKRASRLEADIRRGLAFCAPSLQYAEAFACSCKVLRLFLVPSKRRCDGCQ